MPITVSCPACGSRFSLSDDLYRRRVAGSVVKVKCRNCHAEIAVDATQPGSTSSRESRKRQPRPPRRRGSTQIGLGTPPPPPAELATSSPLPLNLSRSRPFANTTTTPLPTETATATPLTPLSASDAESMWADEETIAINTKTAKAPPRPPARTASTSTVEDPPELIEAEEVPVSSSGAPTLDALTLEAGGAHVPHGKPPPDEFLVSLSASNDGPLGAANDGLLGAPTIDVTSFAAQIDPPSVDVEVENEAATLQYRPARNATLPLFDMSAVLPAADRDATTGSAANRPAEPSSAAANDPHSEGRARDRKFVIAPQDAETALEIPKTRRSSALLWVSLLAAAGVAVVGVRELRRAKPVSSEQLVFVAPASTPVVNTQSALPAEESAAEPSEPASAVPALPAVAAAAQNVSASTAHSVAAGTNGGVKSSAKAFSKETESPSSAAEPAREQPALSGESVEAHNAPAPAAPDTEFDPSAARNALASVATQASSCRKEGDPSGTANLTVTFAPSGRVTSAQVQGPPFAGTATGGCIASTMRRANVPAFSGDYVTVSKTIVVQ